MPNRAAWLTAKQAHPFQIDDAPMPEPKPHQIVIRVRATALNPVDYAMQAMGIILEKYPAIVGVDAAGEVTAVGSSVTEFKVGNRVTGVNDQETPAGGSGTFQVYTKLHATLSAKLPDNISFTDGCVLPLGLCVAATALFEAYNLGLPYPKVEPMPIGKTVLIWGGSSSMGSCAVMEAKAAGLEVATTASAHNAEYCRSIGADHVFDHKSKSIVEDVVASLKGKEFAGAFSAIMGEEIYIKCAEIAHQLGGKQMVVTVLPPMMKVEKPLPHGVEVGYNWGDSIKATNVGPAIWRAWVSDALAKGTLKCKPSAQIVGRGLEKLQEAVDLMGKGVSAKKLVVEIP